MYGTVQLRAGTRAAYTTINAFAQGRAAGQMGLGQQLVLDRAAAGNPRAAPGLGLPGPRRRHRPAEQRPAGRQGQAHEAPSSRCRSPSPTCRRAPATTATRAGIWSWCGRRPARPWRDITLFDGFDFVQVQGGQQLVVGPLDFTGFQTPASGKVDAHVTVWATEGDRGDHRRLPVAGQPERDLRPSDQAARRRAPRRQLLQQHDLQRRRRRRWAHARIQQPARLRPRDAERAGGHDRQRRRPAPRCAWARSATRTSSAGLAFDALIKAPNLDITKVADHTTANPGDVVNYTTTVTNPSMRDPSDPLFGTPVDAATNLVVADQLPSGLDFVGFTPTRRRAMHLQRRGADDHLQRRNAPARRDVHATPTRRPCRPAAQGDTSAPLVNNACYDAELRGPAGRRVPRLRSGDGRGPAGAARAGARRPRRRQDRLAQHRQARGHAHLEGRRHQLRARHLDRVRARRLSCRRACRS